MAEFPAPLTPRAADLRDFPRMMIDVTRLRQSSFDATINDSAWRAGINLWFSAWHALPAGSLDSDDGSLAKAAGLGRDVRTWLEVKDEALRGFVLCADNRFYHETVCEFVLEAWIEKLLQRISSGAGNAKRWSIDFDPAPIEEAIADAAFLLAKLSPSSRMLVKIRRNRARANPTGIPTGTDKPSHRDQESLPMGSQGRGRLKGEGKGDSIDAVAGAHEAEDFGDPFGELGKWTSRFLRAAGIAAGPDTRKYADQTDIARQWLATGLDPETEIIAAIQDRVLNSPQTDRHSLKAFSAMIAEIVARKEATANGKRPSTRPGGRPSRADEIDDAARSLGFG